MEAGWRLRQYFPDISDDDLSTLRLFHVELLRFNQTLNLISNYTEKNADLLHFYDSIKACEFVIKDTTFKNFYDLGSGNGFPGIILAVLAKDIKISLVDSDSRKTDFLKHIIARMDLKNVTIIQTKVEDLKITAAEGVVSRGFSNLARTLLLGNKVFPKGSVIYSLKGSDWFPELTSLPSQICSTWNTEMAMEYDLPENLGTKVILKSVRTA